MHYPTYVNNSVVKYVVLAVSVERLIVKAYGLDSLAMTTQLLIYQWTLPQLIIVFPYPFLYAYFNISPVQLECSYVQCSPTELIAYIFLWSYLNGNPSNVTSIKIQSLSLSSFLFINY